MRSRHLHSSSLVALLVASTPLLAQGVSAQLGGRVLDAKGQAIAGATVVIHNQETGLTRTQQTSSEGRYLATLLPVGPYTVTVTKAGFQTASNVKVNLNLGDAAPLTIRLAAETGAVVEVTASATQLDADRATAATSISPDALASLPVKGRGFIDFATLTPQVQVDSSRGNLAIAGQRGINTSINIDGGDYNQAFFGGMTGSAEGKTPFTVSIEAIREFQVITDGASAEFGRMGGGYVNAITKNGTNDLAGSLFYYTRPHSLVAKDHTTGLELTDFKTEQFGFSVGGPIVKDKLFYFVAVDGQKENRPDGFLLGSSTPPAGLFPLNPAVPADAALIARNADYKTKADSTTVFTRFDWIVNNDHSLQFRVNHSDFKGNVNTGTFNSLDAVSSDDIKTTSLVGQWNWTLGANWVNEFRITSTKDEQPRHPNSTLPQVSVSSVITYGSGPNYEREFETKRTQITETLTYVTPSLQVKGGVDLNNTDVSEVFASTQYGSYSFSDIASFRAGNWSQYQQRFSLIPGLTAKDSGTFSAKEKETALFVQTDWTPTNGVKVGLGLRWDRQEHPDFLIADFSNPMATSMPVTAHIPNDSRYSPRLSVVWTPEEDNGRTVVRANVGRYVSRTPSVFLFQVYAENGVRAARITFTPTATGGVPRGAGFDPANPFVLASLPTVALPALDVFTFSPNFRNPYTDRVNVGVERTYGGWVLGASAAYAKGENLERLNDINLPNPTLNAQGREVFGTRPNTKFRWLAQYTSDVSSTYSALTLSAKYQKDDSPFTAQFFYTFAQNRDNDSNERNFSGYGAQNSRNLDAEWSWADTDRRNTLTGYLNFHERRWTGINFGLNVRYLSGSPYSVFRTTDLNGDGNTSNDRLLGTQRNGFRRSTITNLDLKISRDWTLVRRVKLGLSGEVFNLLNHVDRYAQVRWTSGTDAAPVLAYGQQATSSPRQVQLGARLSF
ncbi:Oar protein [Geothrix limicola]|uniref:Oar protein n=1 Tax=Geothrix limicola TaxID=2927978 RepID=A0ABQ5QDI0_9BACT|nr:TonB-dependent receptor [Geothrix limicola]GLH72104.1 Oar protein [Geothrix limicola]